MSAEMNVEGQSGVDLRFLRNVAVKALLLFLVLNGLFTLGDPLPTLGRISAYNLLYPGRERLPFGENPAAAYNLSLNNLEAMLAAHKLSGSPKGEDEYRVLLVGDSSVWGFLLPQKETLSAKLNDLDLVTEDGKSVAFYNLGYPTISLTKDLLLLERALRYQADLIVWMVTLESFPYEKQVFTPLVQHNAQSVRRLIERHELKIDPQDPGFVDPTLLEASIVGQRRALADLLRLQLYGVLWAATGIDQEIPETYMPRQEDLEAEEGYYGLRPPALGEEDIAFDVLAAGIREAASVPVLIVNEPMFVSQGENSELRYNFFYPRWVYDAYRALLDQLAAESNWRYLDAWLAVDNGEFTNSAIHLSSEGTQQLADFIAPTILHIANE